jgi:hypothetical protein
MTSKGQMDGALTVTHSAMLNVSFMGENFCFDKELMRTDFLAYSFAHLMIRIILSRD